MRYNKFRYIYPPRPVLYTLKQIDNFTENHVAQLKLNGTRTGVVIFPDKSIEFWTRHETQHKAYKVTDSMRDSLLSLDLSPRQFYYFDAELLHSKSSLIKDTIVLYDLFVYRSKYLFGITYADRLKHLRKLCGKPKILRKDKLAYKVNDNVMLIKSYKKNFKKIFDRAHDHPIIEGVVVKNVKAELGYHYAHDKCNWMGKIRVPTNSYKL